MSTDVASRGLPASKALALSSSVSSSNPTSRRSIALNGVPAASNSSLPMREVSPHGVSSAGNVIEVHFYEEYSDTDRKWKCVHQVEIEILDFYRLKLSNGVWESKPLHTSKHYKYVLIVRPNGLKYTESFKNSIGVWLKPVPSDRDQELDFPAKVMLGLRVDSPGNTGEEKGLSITRTLCEWDLEDTRSRYPVCAFEPTITHRALEKIDFGENLKLLIEEWELQ